MGFSPSEKHSTTTSIFSNIVDAATGSFSQGLTVSGTAVGLGEQQKLIVLREEQASGVASGTFTLGAFRTRAINTIVVDETGDVSLSSNQFTLPAGTYKIASKAHFFATGQTISRLQNITDASTTLLGVNGHNTVAANADGGISHVDGQFTITASKTFELQQRSLNTKTSNGFGTAHSFGVNEVYVHIELLKMV